MAPISSLILFTTLALSAFVSAKGPHYMPDHELAQRETAELHRRNLELEERSKTHHRHHHSHHHGKKGSKRHHKNGSKKGSKRGSGTKKCPTGGNSGSTSKGSSTSSAAGSKQTNQPASGASSSTTAASLSALGVNQFLGTNGPGIGSWFRTDASSDSTNGHSWCGYPYNDDSNGFAPDVSLMLNNFGGDYTKAATAYCGLEAIVTNPMDGTSKTMYIIDGFDSRWVRSPGSIDITKNRFAELYGSATDDKDIVIKGITWKLTGNRSDQYKFKGAGN